VLRVDGRIRVPLRELEWTESTSGGPGGQNVNRVHTKMQLRWPLDRTRALPPDVLERLRARHPRRITSAGELVITSQRYRSQQRNAEDCLEKLRELLLGVARAPVVRRATKPSRGAKERRLGEKKRRAALKRDRGSLGD
jgi:ribosome-associated protein